MHTFFKPMSALFALAVLFVPGLGLAENLKGTKVAATEQIARDVIPGEWVGIYKSASAGTGEVYDNDTARYVLKSDGNGTYEHPRGSGGFTWSRNDDGTLNFKFRNRELVFVLSRDGDTYHLQTSYQAKVRGGWIHDRSITLAKKRH